MTPDRDRYYVDRRAARDAGARRRAGAVDETTVVGQAAAARRRLRARRAAAAVYPSDVLLPGMLYGAILRCPHAHANVKAVDTSRAEKMPGVRAVITDASPGADIPWSLRARAPLSRLFDRTAATRARRWRPWQPRRRTRPGTRCARSRSTTRCCPSWPTCEEALKPGAARHPRAAATESGNGPGTTSGRRRGRLRRSRRRRRADLHDGLRDPHADGAARVRRPVGRQPARRLGLDPGRVRRPVGAVAARSNCRPSSVRVIGHYMGGGFGRKLSIGKYTVIAALLARQTGAPGQALPDARGDASWPSGNRPPNNDDGQGRREEGRHPDRPRDRRCSAPAAPIRAAASGGVDWLVRDLYTCPNVRTELTDVYINAGPARPFRAPGHPQGAWALEQMMDAAGREDRDGPGRVPREERSGRQPGVERRSAVHHDRARRSASRRARRRSAGARHGSAGSGDGAIRPRRRHGRRPVAGRRRRTAVDGHRQAVRRRQRQPEHGRERHRHRDQDGDGDGRGRGAGRSARRDPGRARRHRARRSTPPPSGGSKTVPTEAPAVRAAALDVKQQLLAMAAAQLKVPRRAISCSREGEIVSTADASKKVALTAAGTLRQRGLIVGVGYRGPNPEGKVDLPVRRAVRRGGGQHADRRGASRPLPRRPRQRPRDEPPDLSTTRCIGGITMGIGLALTEGRVLDRRRRARWCNATGTTTRSRRRIDVPADMTVLPIDLHDSEANTTGAKGLGEPATIPTARRHRQRRLPRDRRADSPTRRSIRRGSPACWPRREKRG